MTFAADDRALAVSSADGSIRFFNPKTGERIGEPLVHPAAVITQHFRPDGRMLCTIARDGLLRMWDVPSGRPIGTPRGYGLNCGLPVFSPDGSMFATVCADNTVRFWSGATGAALGQPIDFPEPVGRIKFSPDGVNLAVELPGRDITQVWNLASTAEGKAVPMAGVPGLTTSRHSARPIRYSRDGKRVGAVTRDSNAWVMVWDAETGAVLTGQGTNELVSAWDISYDGSRVATAGYAKLARVYSVEKPTRLIASLPHDDIIEAIAISPEGTRVITSARNGHSQVWDASSGKPIGNGIKATETVSRVAFGPDGKFVAGIFTHTNLRSGRVRVWDAQTGEPRAQPPDLKYRTEALAFRPDGRALFFGGQRGDCRQWDLARGAPTGPTFAVQKRVTAAAYSPDGKRLATAFDDHTIGVWDVTTGTRVCALLRHSKDVANLAFSADGGILAVSAADALRFWDVASGQPIGPDFSGSDADAFEPALNPQLTSVAVYTGASGRALEFAALPSRIDADDELLTRWIRVSTGLEYEPSGGRVQLIDTEVWRSERHHLLEAPGAIASLLTARPSEIAWHRRKADEFRALQSWANVIRHLDPLINAAPADQDLILRRAAASESLGNFAAAALDLARAIEITPERVDLRGRRANDLMLAADVVEFRKCCAEWVETVKTRSRTDAPQRAAEFAIVLPDTVTDVNSLLRLEQSVRAFSARDSASPYVAGALNYRAGRHADALGHLERALAESKNLGHVGLYAFLAMTHHRLGHAEDAAKYLDKAREWVTLGEPWPGTYRATMEQKPSGIAMRRLLLREAETLIAPAESRK